MEAAFEYVIADLWRYLAGAFAVGFVLSWIVCARPEPLARAEGERRRGPLGWLWRGGHGVVAAEDDDAS